MGLEASSLTGKKSSSPILKELEVIPPATESGKGGANESLNVPLEASSEKPVELPRT